MSDLHIAERGPRDYAAFLSAIQTDADVLVLAGDIISAAPRDVEWSTARLKHFAEAYEAVVFVPGNHEFYGTSIAAGMDRLREMAAKAGIYLLEPEKIVEIGGRRFLGGTLWQPAGTEADAAAPISDHRHIYDFATEAPKQFEALRDFLDAELRAGDVVVTHHAPSMQSLAPQWFGDPCNRWFITHEMEPLLRDRGAALWVHGHVHTPFNYRLGTTQVVCNPRGYLMEGVEFNYREVAELG